MFRGSHQDTYSKNQREKVVTRSIHQHIKTVNTDRLQSSRNIKRTHKKPFVKACSFSCYCPVVNKWFYFKCDRYKDSLYTLIHVGSRPIRISLAGKYTIKINIKICNLKTVLQQLRVSASILAFSHQSRVSRFFKNVESEKHNSFAQKFVMISQRTQRRLLYEALGDLCSGSLSSVLSSSTPRLREDMECLSKA